MISYSVEDRLCRLTLNRPEKLNALNVAAFHELAAHLDRLGDDNVDCVLLSGAGRAFCAGHDLNALADGSENLEAVRFESGVIERLASLPMPVVAAIQGACFTGGLELALAADIIIAADDAKFADTHAKWDLVPVWGLSQRLPRRISGAKAREMMFACRTYSGIEAARMGLANHSVPATELEAVALKLCREILANSGRATRAMKRLLIETDAMTLADGMAWELDHSAGIGPELVARLTGFKKS